MELKFLDLFEKIVETRSFTKAAEELYLSQPTLSKSLKSLEQTLDVQLIERTTKSVEVTDAGKIVYEQSKKISLLIEELYTLINDLKDVKIGEVKIGIPPLIGTLFFSKLASQFKSIYPNISISLIELGAKKVNKLVKQQEAHLGFTVLPIHDPTINVIPFIEDEFVLVVSKSHQLASYQSTAIVELVNESFILFTEDFALYDVVKEECSKNHFVPQVAYRTSQWDLMIELVSANLGVTLLPRAILDKTTNNNIKVIDLKDDFKWRIGVVTNKNAYLPYAAKKFIEMIEMKNGSIYSNSE